MKKTRVLSYPLSAKQRLWSEWADAQVDLSLRWAQMPVCWFCDALDQLSLPQHQKTYLRKCAPREDSDQPAHSRSLIRIFTRRIWDCQGCKVYSCRQRRLWSDCTDAQADLSLRWAHMSVSTHYGLSGFCTINTGNGKSLLSDHTKTLNSLYVTALRDKRETSAEVKRLIKPMISMCNRTVPYFY